MVLGETSGDRLFGRRARVVIGSLEVESEGEQGLQISFTVSRGLQRTLNKASVQIRNLSDDTRARIEGQQPKLTIEAGYEDTMAGLFAGDKAVVSHTKQGVDWVTSISAGDGQAAFEQRVKLGFGPGVTARQVADLLKKLGGSFVGALKGGASTTQALERVIYKAGKSFEGKLGDALQQVADDAGLELSVQDGELVLLGENEAFAADAIELGPASGLIGSPQRVQDPKRPKALILRGQALLMPGITPGRRLLLTSEAHSGVFKVTKANHRGDTHGGDGSWVTAWEAQSVP